MQYFIEPNFYRGNEKNTGFQITISMRCKCDYILVDNQKQLESLITYLSSRSFWNFCLANSRRPSTSSLDRLKFSILNAYTVTSVIPRSEHHCNVCMENNQHIKYCIIKGLNKCFFYDIYSYA